MKENSWRMRAGLRLVVSPPGGPIADAPLPERVVLSLSRHRPVVEKGAHVSTGTVVAIPRRPAASPLHSPISGTVEALSNKELTITRSGEDRWETLAPLAESASPEELRKRLYDCGVCALVPGGIPSGHGSSVAEGKKVEHLVLVLSATEPYLPDPMAIAHGRLEELATGIRVLAKALAVPAVHAAGTKSALDASSGALSGVRLHELPDRHPAMSELMLAYIALGYPKRLPQRAIETGVLVVDIQAALAAYEAVFKGRAAVERVIALGGDGLRKNICIRCRVGTVMADILKPELREGVECAFVRGGVMTGTLLPKDALGGSISRRDMAIAALQNGSFRRQPGYPCVYCTRCADVCPVSLAPYMFHRAASQELVDEAESAGIDSCVECGLCSYVCPSRLDLFAEIKHLKEMLRQDREAAR